MRERVIQVRRFLLAVLCASGLTACQMRGGTPVDAPTRTAAEVIALHSDSLMAIPGVVGVYETAGRDGKPVLRVMLAERSPEAARRGPKRLDGYRVEFEVTGPIKPM